jgi:hypothetical protein
MEKTLEEQIVELHGLGKSMREIERITNSSLSKVRETINLIGHDDAMAKTYPQIDGKDMYAVCKKTGRELIDYKNVSGALTTHLKEIYPNIVIDTNFKRKTFEYTNKRYWYHDYFDFIYKDYIKTVKCRYCDWETEDVDNLAGSYQLHTLNVHNITGDEHIKQFPDDIKYFKHITKRDKTPEHTVICLECGEKFLFLNDKHLAKHNLTRFEYLEKYKLPDDYKLISDKTISNFKNNFTTKPINITKYNKSKAEIFINNYIQSLGYETITSDRNLLSGSEIDIVIPDLKLAIEYNGLYYHGEFLSKNGSDYHLNKQITLNNIGYDLIHIFEDDWYLYKDNIVNRLKSVLDKNKLNNTYDLNYHINIIDVDTKNSFINKYKTTNMIIDDTNICLGIYYNSMLSSVMTFKSIGGDGYILKTYLTNYVINIPNEINILLNKFKEVYKPKYIIGYWDNCWNDNIFNDLKFQKLEKLPPQFWLFKRTLMRRGKKHQNNINELLDELIPNHSELLDNEICNELSELGYDRIWDCGLTKYRLDIK